MMTRPLIHPNAGKIVRALDHLLRARAELIDCMSGPGDVSTPQMRDRLGSLDAFTAELIAELHTCADDTPTRTATGHAPDLEWYRRRP